MAVGEGASPPPPRKSLGHFVKTNADTIERLVKWVPVTAKDVVLDIGCGDGGLLVGLIKATGCRGVGVEVDPALCKVAQEAARAEGYDERRFKLYSKPIEDVPFRNFLEIHRVSVVYIYALFVSQNEKVIALLQQFIVHGIAVVTSTFELPVAELAGFSRVWPDPDTPEGLLELACPTCTTKLHLYQGDECLSEVESRRYALDLVEANASRFKYIPKRFRGDKDIVLKAVSGDGWNLQYASEDLRDDIQVVRHAVHSKPKAIKYAGVKVKHDKALAIFVVKMDGGLLRYFPDDIRKDMLIAGEATEDSSRARAFVRNHVPSQGQRGRREHIRCIPVPPRHMQDKGFHDAEGHPDLILREVRKEPEEETSPPPQMNEQLPARRPQQRPVQAPRQPQPPPRQSQPQPPPLPPRQPQPPVKRWPKGEPKLEMAEVLEKELRDHVFWQDDVQRRQQPEAYIWLPTTKKRVKLCGSHGPTVPRPAAAPLDAGRRQGLEAKKTITQEKPKSVVAKPRKSAAGGLQKQPPQPHALTRGGTKAPSGTRSPSSVEEEPEREPEEEPLVDPAASMPKLGEETWKCQSCTNDTGVSYSRTECAWCGEVRGQGVINDIWGELDMDNDPLYSRVVGVLRDDIVHTDDGWQLPVSLGGVEVLRPQMPAEPVVVDGAGEAPPPLGEQGGEEVERTWQVMKPWQFWHKKSDDKLLLYNADSQTYHGKYCRAGKGSNCGE